MSCQQPWLILEARRKPDEVNAWCGSIIEAASPSSTFMQGGRSNHEHRFFHACQDRSIGGAPRLSTKSTQANVVRERGWREAE